MFWWTQSLTIQTTCIVKLINWDVLHRKKRWYHGDKGWNSCALLFGPKLHIWFTWHTLFYSAFWNSIFLLMQLLLIKIIAKLCTCVLYRLLWSKSSKIVLIKYTNRIQRMVLRCPISNDINFPILFLYVWMRITKTVSSVHYKTFMKIKWFPEHDIFNGALFF